MRVLKNIISLVFLSCLITSSPVKDENDDHGHEETEKGIKRMETSLPNPDEVGGSDILIPHRSGRSGVLDKCMLWIDAKIPFKIDNDYSVEEYEMIIKAIRTIEFWTCIKFLPYNPTVIHQPDYVIIGSRPGHHCKSYLGRSGGGQAILLESSACFGKIGYILHELLHTIGIVDEHSRADRDDYISIDFKNIKPEDRSIFDKDDESVIGDYGVPYDYNSVMQYSEFAYSMNQQKTIIPKVPGAKIGQREGLSVRDAIKIMKMYNCGYKSFNVSNKDPFSRVMPNLEESPLSKDELYDMYYRNISFNEKKHGT